MLSDWFAEAQELRSMSILCQCMDMERTVNQLEAIYNKVMIHFIGVLIRLLTAPDQLISHLTAFSEENSANGLFKNNRQTVLFVC